MATTNVLIHFHDDLTQLLTARPGGDVDWYYVRASAVLDALHAMPANDLLRLLKSSHSRGIGVLRGIPTASANLAIEREDVRWLELGLRGLQILALVDDPRDMDSQIHTLEASALKLGTHLHHLWKPTDLPGKEWLTYRFDPVAVMKAKAEPPY